MSAVDRNTRSRRSTDINPNIEIANKMIVTTTSMSTHEAKNVIFFEFAIDESSHLVKLKVKAALNEYHR